jgi:hypothetical protein
VRIVLGSNRVPGQIPAPGDGLSWRAFSIHPASLVDRVYVDDELLVVGSLVYVSSPTPNLRAARGFPTGPQGANGSFFGGPEVNSPIVLQGYRTCDDIEQACKARAPWSDGVMLNVGTGSGGSAPLQTIYQSAPYLTVPFMGRRHATFFFHADSNATAGTSQVQITIRGRRYLNPLIGAKVGNSATGLAHVDENAAAFTYTYTQSPLDTSDICLTVHVGGYDSEEAYDELEVWAKKTSVDVWNGNFYIDAEAYGERPGP